MRQQKDKENYFGLCWFCKICKRSIVVNDPDDCGHELVVEQNEGESDEPQFSRGQRHDI